MGRIYTGLAVWNLVVLAAAGVVGALAARTGAVEPRAHVLAGLFAAFFCCLAHSILVTHFIGSMKWIQQTGPTAGIEDTRELRRAWIRGRTFPTLVVAMLLAVLTAALGGSASSGGAGATLHAALAALCLVVNVLALAWGREGIRAQSERMRRVAGLAADRQRRGDVEEPAAETLLPESSRAGGKTLLWLAANVWVLYVYVRFVLRNRDEPWLPYAIASAFLALVGWGLLRSSVASADQTGAGDAGKGARP